MLTFVTSLPPVDDIPPAKAAIAATLVSNPGQWAIVAYPDRVDRAEATAARINAGTEYGPGFEAVVRSHGSRAAVRVFARFV